MSSIRTVDVLIVGAGPVGLLTAYQLARFSKGTYSVAIIEKVDKTASAQDAYGRAITLYPRSMELLDAIGLADEIAQQCFACRETVTYNSSGEEIKGRGWSFMETAMKDSAWDFALVLRQKYQEDIFRKALKALGVEVEAPVALTAIDIDECVPRMGHRVNAATRNEITGDIQRTRCRFLIGSDGGRSSVRRMVDIPFPGTSTEDKWVRIDGLVKTNHPKPRSYCAIESPTHGNVLWVGLDRGRTRIGYAFTSARTDPYDNFDEATAVKEAIAAVKPFDLEFECVDWWTIYSVGQRIAESFFVKDSVFLAGDSAHTHSSGAAQGENTGIHDCVNLAWKLSLVLQGKAGFELLHTYQAERLPNVHKLIQYDKDISRLMTNRLPEKWTGDPEVDLNQLLGQVMAEAASFSCGLGISYEHFSGNPLNDIGSLVETESGLRSGHRAPDVTLLKPGTFEPIRLVSVTPNMARFHVVVFTGDENAAIDFMKDFPMSKYLNALADRDLLQFVTVLPDVAPSVYDKLGHEGLGSVFFDGVDSTAYTRYGIRRDQGGLIVLRPDGWIGNMVMLRKEAVSELEGYFQAIFRG